MDDVERKENMLKYYEDKLKERDCMNVSERMTYILNYYQENPGCDPNMNEFVELCYDMTQYLAIKAPNYGIHASGRMITNEEGELVEEKISKEEAKQKYPIPCAVYDKFMILSEQLEGKLLGNDLGITEESPLYKLYAELTRSVASYGAYDDTLLRAKLGGVALFIAQQNRRIKQGEILDFTYNNSYEMEEIEEMNELLSDPTTIGRTEKELMEQEPSPRQQLFEEIAREYKKGSKIR